MKIDWGKIESYEAGFDDVASMTKQEKAKTVEELRSNLERKRAWNNQLDFEQKQKRVSPRKGV